MAQTQEPKKAKTIEIYVNNKEVTLSDKDTTGEEIKNAAGIPLGFKLYDEEGKEIGNEEHVKVHKHQKFTAISGQDVS